MKMVWNSKHFFVAFRAVFILIVYSSAVFIFIQWFRFEQLQNGWMIESRPYTDQPTKLPYVLRPEKKNRAQ